MAAKKKKIIEFIPFFIMVAINVVVLAIYLFVMQRRQTARILATFLAPCVALIIPVVNRIFRITIPFALNVAITAFAFLAMDMAAVLDFYAIIPQLDKVLHTVFGIIGGFGGMIFLMYGNGEKLKKPHFYILIMLFVLGCAAFWEIFEYVAGFIVDMDMQHRFPEIEDVGNLTVSQLQAMGFDPLCDTMWDIIVAAFGVCVFYAVAFIDKLKGYKLFKSIYRQVKGVGD